MDQHDANGLWGAVRGMNGDGADVGGLGIAFQHGGGGGGDDERGYGNGSVDGSRGNGFGR